MESQIESKTSQNPKEQIYFKNLATLTESEREFLLSEIKRQNKYMKDHPYQ